MSLANNCRILFQRISDLDVDHLWIAYRMGLHRNLIVDEINQMPHILFNIGLHRTFDLPMLVTIRRFIRLTNLLRDENFAKIIRNILPEMISKNSVLVPIGDGHGYHLLDLNYVIQELSARSIFDDALIENWINFLNDSE